MIFPARRIALVAAATLLALAGCRKPLYRAQVAYAHRSKPQSTVLRAPNAELQALITEEAKKLPGTASVHVQVEGGPEAGVDPDRPMPAASVIKLPIMAVVEDAWRAKQFPRTPRELQRVRKMITESNNAAADYYFTRLGATKVNGWLSEHGYNGTVLRHRMLAPARDGDNAVTARAMTRMLLQIEAGQLVSADASTEMREILLDQKRRSRIPAGVPDGVPVGNKTGTLHGVVNDVAFVEPPGGKRYALAVLVSHAASDEATSAAIAQLSAGVYAYLSAQRAPSSTVLGHQ